MGKGDCPDERPSRWLFPSPESTLAAGAALARAFLAARSAAELEGPLVVALAGELGAGKTQLAKGIGAGLGYAPSALASPTFTIANHYPLEGGGALVHIDAFRLADATELLATGFDDALEPVNLVVVEWPERVADALPADRVAISLRIERRAGAEGLVDAPRIGDAPAPLGAARTAELRALGCEAARVARRLRDELAASPDVSRCEGASREREE